MTEAASLNAKLLSFKDDISKLLASAPPAPLPECPKAAFKSCVIYLGQPSSEAWCRLRTEAHWPAFILMTFPPECEGAAQSLKASLPPSDRTLFATLSPDGSHAELAGMLVASANASSVKFVVEKSAEAAFGPEASRISEAVREAVRFVSMEKAASLLKLREAICNLPSVFSGKSCSVSAPERQNIPAVVCGAGPSLLDDLATLRSFRDRIAVFAVGHAGERLMEAGVVPDFIVEVDQACGGNYRDGSAIPCPLAILNDADPSVPQRFEKVLWLEGDSFAFNKLASACGMDFFKAAVSYSVAITALDLAAKLGFRTIALVGNDLCLSGDGLSHAGERAFQEDESEYVSILGNDGSQLASTSDFVEIKQRIEKYASHAINSGKPLEIVNSTSRGAAIQGLSWKPLKDFCETRCPSAPAKPAFAIAPSKRAKDSLERLKKTAASLSSWRQCLFESSGMARRLARELNNSNPEMRRAQELRSQISTLLEKSAALVNSSPASPIAKLIEAQASAILEESPGSPQDADLRLHFEFLKDIVSDFEKDLNSAIAAIEAGQDWLDSDPFKFEAFKKFAVSFILQSNRELASRIDEGSFDSFSAGFELKSKWLSLPLVWRKASDGSKPPLSGNLSRHSQAERNVEAFIKANSFEPAKHAVAFLAPGNWVDVAAFAKRFPGGDLKCMVVEPWPELLSELARRSMFLHLLPQKTPIVAVHESLRDWRKIYLDTLKEWRDAGRRTLFYKCPGPWELQEVRDIFKDIAP